MRYVLRCAAALLFATGFAVPALASPVTESIDAAVKAGDYAALRGLSKGPESDLRYAILALLRAAEKDYKVSPERASRAASVAAALAAGSAGAEGGKEVASVLRALVAMTLEGGDFVCNPETGVGVAKQGGESAQKKAAGFILVAVKKIAELPLIVASDPGLFEEVQAKTLGCEAEDVQFALLPSLQSFGPLFHGRWTGLLGGAEEGKTPPPPPPPREEGSAQ